VSYRLTWTLWSCVGCRRLRFTVGALALEAACEHGKLCPWHSDYSQCVHINPRLVRFLVGHQSEERARQIFFGEAITVEQPRSAA